MPSLRRIRVALRKGMRARELRGKIRQVRDFIDYYFFELFDRLDKINMFLLAGGVSFSLLICSFPIVLILLWILGIFLNTSDVALQVYRIIDALIPYSAYSGYVKEILTSRMQELVEYKSIAGIVGFVGILFAASSFFSTVRTSLNMVYGAERDHSLWFGKLVDFLYVLLSMVFFLVSLIVFPIVYALIGFASTLPFDSTFPYFQFSTLLASAFSALLIFIIFYFFYSTIPVPAVRIKNKSSLIGASVSTALWIGAREAFGYYIYNLASYGQIYGTYALIVVVAFWIYYSSIVFLVGAMVGKLHHDKSEKVLAAV